MSVLYRDWIAQMLPPIDSVQQIDAWMDRYCEEDSPVFTVRAVRGASRRQRYSTCDGTIIAPADNSPAWVLHALLVENRITSDVQFRELMCQMPAHMFDIKRLVQLTANDYGWYVAHLLPVKNGNTDFYQWTRREGERRFFATLHPCNLFFVPGVRNRLLGEDAATIAFVARQFAMRYGALWHKFVARAVPENRKLSDMSHPDDFTVRYPFVQEVSEFEASGPPSSERVRVRYRASRLTFKRDVIEALDSDDLFEVITPMGTYRFSKRQFYDTFPNIPRTQSYKHDGRYHGARLHSAAERFRITS